MSSYAWFGLPIGLGLYSLTIYFIKVAPSGTKEEKGIAQIVLWAWLSLITAIWLAIYFILEAIK